MVDFDEARAAAFKLIENTRTVEQISEEVKNNSGGKTTKTFWRVIVEVPVEDQIRDFTLEIFLNYDFPLSLPQIKLAESDYQQTKYLPHVDDKRCICLFDQETIKQNTDDPAGIVNECVNQAVRILADGLNKDRVAEFNDEIIAYWENKYHKEDNVVSGYIGSNMSCLKPGNVAAYYLQQPHANANLYVGNDEVETNKLIEFFKFRGHTLQNLDAFYLGEVNELNPPFYFTNKSLLEFMRFRFHDIWKEIKSYLNRNSHLSKFLLFSVVSGGQSLFLGFYWYPLKKDFKGWRSGYHSTVEIMTSIIPAQGITRVRFIEFHPSRLQARTDGKSSDFPDKKFMLAGLGSIGSNLLFYLNSLIVSKYILVDPEILALENVNRHLLSFNDVGYYKVDGIAKYLTLQNPFVDITKKAGSVVDLVQRNLKEINEVDLIFCALGKDAIESYILQQLAAGHIQKPVLFFWVEPYLLGAHILYITPNTTFTLKDLEVDGYFKFNILAPETYKDPSKKISLREAGCQGSYMPYGKAEIVRFFAAIIPDLFNVIQTPPDSNLAITYAGDLNMAAKLNLSISDLASGISSYQILIQAI